VSFAALSLGVLAVIAVELVALGLGRARLERRGFSVPIAVASFVAFASLALALRGTFAILSLDLELDGGIVWTAVALGGIGVGAAAAARARRMPNAELGIAGLLLMELLVASLLYEAGGASLSSPPMRALLIAPAALALCTSFGASLGYLVFAGDRAELALGYESMVARRFLLSKSSPALSTVTTISVVGVMLGVMLVIMALAVLSGFESDLQRKIIGTGAHVVIEPQSGPTLKLTSDMLARAEQAPGVVAAAPYLESEVAVASSQNFSGAVLFGIDPRRGPRVLEVLQELQSGSLAGLNGDAAPPAEAPSAPGSFAKPARVPGVVIGIEMAKSLSVHVGDRVRLLSPTLEVMTPVGMAPRSMGFEVVGIFASKMYEYDARYIYVSLDAARRFLELDPEAVSGVQLRTADPERSERVGKLAAAATGGRDLVARDWRARNQTLFAALKLERIVAFVVLVFIILVASFSIVNTLAMSIIEKKKEIAILKTMGSTDAGIMKLFVIQGLLVGGFGAVLGAVLGVGLVLAIERFGFWIPGEVYYIDSLPVELNGGDAALVLAAALLIVWSFAVFPALGGAKLEPVEGLRDG